MPINLIGNLPERLTQELLVGKLLVGGLGVAARSALAPNNNNNNNNNNSNSNNNNNNNSNSNRNSAGARVGMNTAP